MTAPGHHATHPVVEARDLTLFRTTPAGQSLHVLDKVSFAVAENEFVAVVGPSGCGKTTLLKLLDGLLEPTSGPIHVDGQEVRSPGIDRGFVFQQDALFPWRTVLQNIGLGLEAQDVKRQEIRRVAQELAELVGLRGFERHYPHQLSGGMRQRVNVARALAVDPKVLLMDEPFSSLDAQTRESMQAELLRIWAERNKTVLFVTHQIDEAAFLADRVLVLSARPGHVKREIPIDIPRPRQLSVKRTPEFIGVLDAIWSEIDMDEEKMTGKDAVPAGEAT